MDSKTAFGNGINMDRLSPGGNSPGDSRPEFLVILGLLPPCSEEDVQRAYRARVAKLHPDHGGSQAEFIQLQEAYEQAQEYARFQEGRRQWLANQVEPYVAQQAIVAATKEARQKLRHVDNSRKDEKASPDKCLRD